VSVSSLFTRTESLERRTMFSVPEPNNSFQDAYTPPDNIYLEHNMIASDSVSAGDPDDYFKFYNLYGASHAYLPLNGLSSDADLYVYNQNQVQIASSTAGGNTSELINVDLSGNQYFYVRVHKFGSGSTNYNLYLYNDYAGSSLGTARDIGTSWGQGSDKFWAYNKISSEDYLDYRDNVDYVKFRMEAPGTVSTRMKSFVYGTGTELVAGMQLLDSSGTVIKDAGTGMVNQGLNIDRFTLNTGTYYVKFRQISGNDPYTFRITSDYAGDITATARNLGNLTGSSREEYDMVGGPFGLPTYEDSMDLYKFNVTKTSPLDMRLTIEQGLTPPTFDADLHLARDLNNDGFITSNEYIANSTNAGTDSISTTLSAGTYYVVVVPNGFYTSYKLALDSDFDANPGDPAAYKNMSKATSAGTLNGETFFDNGFGISAGDFADYYKFTMGASGKFQASAYDNPFYSRTDYVPQLQVIRDLNNNQRFDNGEAIATGSGLVNANLSAGTYYLGVSGNGLQAAYSLRMVPDYAGNSLGSARAMGAITTFNNVPNQVFRDYIEQNFGGSSDVDDFYRFDLPDQYSVTLMTTGVSGEDLSLSLIKDANNNGVIDSGDTLQTSNNSNSPNESITRTLSGGRYFARVRGVNGATNYTLTAKFAGKDPDDTFAELVNNTRNTKTLGQFADFTMAPKDDVDLIKFTINTVGQKVGFDVDSRNGSNLDTYLRLFNSSGTRIASNNNGAAPGESASNFSYLSYRFASKGTYYIGVSLNPNNAYSPITGNGDVPGGTTGAYRITLNNLGVATQAPASMPAMTSSMPNSSPFGKQPIAGEGLSHSLLNDVL
jgi:hypothetical protein